MPLPAARCTILWWSDTIPVSVLYQVKLRATSNGTHIHYPLLLLLVNHPYSFSSERVRIYRFLQDHVTLQSHRNLSKCRFVVSLDWLPS
jgi:hypothetical protein